MTAEYRMNRLASELGENGSHAGGASSSHPLMRRTTNKRNFSEMSASHRDESPDSLFVPHDDHYENDHAPRRRRLHRELPQPYVHYPGDGLDFRRPVMSTSAAAPAVNGNVNTSHATVIDLTDEDGTEESQGGRSEGTTAGTQTEALGAGSSRAQRLPRFGRHNIIDIESPPDEDNTLDTANLPGASYLALPGRHPRPQYSSLRRPHRPPSPPPEMDEEVEFVQVRPRSRPTVNSRPPSPPRISRHPRSVTPYPTNMVGPIDLTEDNDDDDIMMIESRPREDVNLPRPDIGIGAGLGARSNADLPNFGLGQIANIMRGEGNMGGRLFQRIQDFMGFEPELRAQQQAFDQFQHNHGGQGNRNHGQNHDGHGHRAHQRQHHHHHHQRAMAAAAAVHEAANGHYTAVVGIHPVQAMPGMPGMMDYATTGFDMGLRGGNRPPTPNYSPPPSPAKGFTRAPAEEEVVVCPNCGDELALGDSDIKQEVWIIKGCGHAYCGVCARNRGRSMSKKGKGKAPAIPEDPTLPPPFKKCVVEGCGKPAAKNSMTHVFLGS